MQPVVVAMMAVGPADRNTSANGRDYPTLNVHGMMVTWYLKTSKSKSTASSEDTILTAYPLKVARCTLNSYIYICFMIHHLMMFMCMVIM